MAHIDARGELAVGLCLREQLTKHVCVRGVGSVAGQDAVFLSVALEDRLDDQLAGIARHGSLEAAQRLGDNGFHLVIGLQQRPHGFLRGARRQHADLEKDVLLGGKIEVEQRPRHTRRAADVGDRRLRVAVRAPQRHRRLHQAASRLMRSRPLIRGTSLTTVSNWHRAVFWHNCTVTARSGSRI